MLRQLYFTSDKCLMIQIDRQIDNNNRAKDLRNQMLEILQILIFIFQTEGNI